MTSLFTGGGSDDAAKAAELSRREQQIANDRQLASLSQQDSDTTVRRRAPRGRRLFTEKDTLA